MDVARSSTMRESPMTGLTKTFVVRQVDLAVEFANTGFRFKERDVFF